MLLDMVDGTGDPLPEHRVLFGRLKAHGARVSDVATEIGVSAGYLYRYFRGELPDGLRTGAHRRLVAYLDNADREAAALAAAAKAA